MAETDKILVYGNLRIYPMSWVAYVEDQEVTLTRMEFDVDQWYSMVDFVTVFNKEDVRFTFKDGTEIKV